MNILFLCFRKGAYKPSFPESFGDRSCGWGLLLWAAKLFLLESHRSVWIVWVCTVVKETTQPTPSPPPALPAFDPQESCGPAIFRQWGLPEFVAINLFLPISVDWVWPRLFPSQSTLLKNFFKTLCVFHGKFHTPVSGSFSIKGSKYWFCKSPLMIPNFVGSFFLSS